MKYIFTCLLALMAFSISAQKLGRPVAFDSIQYVTDQELENGNDEPTYFGDGRNSDRSVITVEGVVCPMHPGFYGLSATSRKSTMVFSKDHTGKWSGLEVMASPGNANTESDLQALISKTRFYENFIPGFTVKFRGELGDFQGNTQLLLDGSETEVTRLTKTEIKPTVVTIDQFKDLTGVDQYQTGEPYEHVYVEFRDVRIVNVEEWDAGRWNWSIQDADGHVLDTRDFSGYFRGDENTDSTIQDATSFQPPPEGTFLDYLRGVIVQSNFAGYQIAPLVPSDVKIGIVVPFITNRKVTPQVPESSDDIVISTTITDDGTIENATLNYAVGIESTDWKTMKLNNTNGDDWEANIGKFPNETLLKMFITAEDNEKNISTIPDSSGLRFITKVVDGGIRRISDIQKTPKIDGSSIYDGVSLENISVSGLVTATQKDLGIAVIQEGFGPYSGIFIKNQPGSGLESLEQGDLVTITAATVEEDWSVTYLTEITYTKTKGPGLPDPLRDISYTIFESINDSSEAYEGMYMEWTDVVAVDTFPDIGEYGEWTFGKDTLEGTPTLRVDDLSDFVPVNFAHDSLVPGQELGFIRGIMYYSHEEWKLLPRTLLDIDNWGFVEKDTSSINEVDASINLRVFPNPAKDQLVIAFEEESRKLVNVQIVDVTGKILFEDRIAAGQNQFDVQHLRKGMYIIKLVSPDWSTSKQFIKE